MRRKRKEKEG